MKRIFQFVEKYWMLIVPISLVALFIFSVWDRNYYIGGDLIFPLKPEDNMIKSLFLWEEQNGGISFFKYMLFFWQGFFYLLSLVHIPTDIVIKIFIISIYILGFIFSYLLYYTLFKETKFGSKKLAFFFASIFLFNPAAILILVGTLPLYGIPICFFFLVKYLDTKNIFYSIPFALFINITFFPDLPQAKLLIIFTIASIFLLALYKTIRQVSIKKLIKSIFLLIILTFLLNAFLLLPFINDAIGEKGVYQDYTATVTAYNGDADYLSAALPYISRFYNSNLVGKGSLIGQYLGNLLFILWTFFILLVSIIPIFFVREKKDKQIIYISLFAFIIFVFIAKGANPPFGEIYRWMLAHVFIVKLFRTTATSIIGGVFFYSLLVTIAVYYLSKKWGKIFYIFLFANILMFYPIYLGYKLDTWIGGSVHQKGVSIPTEYYEMGRFLDLLPDDGKILVLPLNDGYIVKNWGYNGQSPTPWLTKKPLLSSKFAIDSNLDTRSSKELCDFASLYNVRYLLLEKDTTSSIIKKNIDFPGNKIMENQYFLLQKTNDACFLPQIYIPEKTIYFKGDIKELKSLPYLPEYKKETFIHREDTKAKTANTVITEKSPQNTTLELRGNFLNLDLGQDKLIQDVFYPSVSVEPDSILYPLILLKEDAKLNDDKLDKRQLLDLQIISALKRISEIERWGVGNTWWTDSQRRYKSTMEKGIQTAVKSDFPRDNLELLFEYVIKNQKKIEEISKTQPFWDKSKINSWEVLFSQLLHDIQRALYIPDFNNLIYNLEVPYAGSYQAYMLRTEGKSLLEEGGKIDVSVSHLSLSTDVTSNAIGKNIVTLGMINMDELTKNFAVRFSNQPNHTNIERWIIGEQVNTVKTDSAGIVFAPNQQNGYYISFNQIVYQEIKNWEKGETYLLKIRHKDSDGASLRLVVREKKETYDRNSDSWIAKEANIVDEYLNTLSEEGESRFLLRADKNVQTAWIYLYVTGGTVKVNNIDLQKIVLPHIFLVGNNNIPQDNLNKKPAVFFEKINPTKYVLKVDAIIKPTTVVFSEAFDKGWKVFGEKGNYVPESSHFFANGYANAWTITPEDANGSHFLTIEYVPQRLFRLGQIVSLISLAGCILIALYTWSRKKRYNNPIKK